jgi:hypothetical protein
METVIRSWWMLRALAQKAGPYLILEILLPGGTLFALILFLYRNRLSSSGVQTALLPASRTAPTLLVRSS